MHAHAEKATFIFKAFAKLYVHKGVGERDQKPKALCKRCNDLMSHTKTKHTRSWTYSAVRYFSLRVLF